MRRTPPCPIILNGREWSGGERLYPPNSVLRVNDNLLAGLRPADAALKGVHSFRAAHGCWGDSADLERPFRLQVIRVAPRGEETDNREEHAASLGRRTVLGDHSSSPRHLRMSASCGTMRRVSHSDLRNFPGLHLYSRLHFRHPKSGGVFRLIRGFCSTINGANLRPQS